MTDKEYPKFIVTDPEKLDAAGHPAYVIVHSAEEEAAYNKEGDSGLKGAPAPKKIKKLHPADAHYSQPMNEPEDPPSAKRMKALEQGRFPHSVED